MAQHASPHAGSLLTIQRVLPSPPLGIALASPALDADGRIDDLYSAYHDDLTPGLSWSAVLDAESFALVVEDPDAPMERPFVHWMLWNIPGAARELPMGISRVAHPPEIPGSIQGRNSAGLTGWHGTKPPPGHGVHHYHFQLFALSARLDHLGPATPLEELVSALKGLTIASGQIVGTYERVDPASFGLDRESEKASPRGGLDSDDVDRHAPHRFGGEIISDAW